MPYGKTIATFLLLTCTLIFLPGCKTAVPPETDQVPSPTQTKEPIGESENRCGDGVCDGPETVDVCPEDCANETGEAAPESTAALFEEVSARPADETGTYWVTNPTSGVELYTTVLRPDDWSGEPLPTLVIIPGGTDDSAGIVEGDSIGPKAVAQGYAVVAFDADGRGQSGGEESYSGFTQQDGLAAVIQFAADLPEVDAERMGLLSFSYGVTLGSGVLARYPELPVRFYIDWEGPADRRDTTIGCKPSSQYDWPACDDDEAWAEREALTFISQIQVPYQRVQNQRDHVQPDVSHAVHMVNAAVNGAAPWVRLNDYPPNETYDPNDPPEMRENRGGPTLDQVMLRYAEELFEVDGAPLDTTSEEASIPPVYVTIAGHIEDVPIYTNCDVYPDYREKLLRFAETIAEYDAAFNLQVEYEFFQGAAQCETEALRASTDGQNVLAYLAAHYGYEIDAHQEGGWEEGADNYADVRFLGEQVVPSISENVGGVVWDDAEQFARLAAGEPGWINPDFTWQPKILSLAVSRQHHLGDFSRDDQTSGIWKPRGAGEDFWRHDPDGVLIYVGPGEHANWDASRPWMSTPDFVQVISEQLEQEILERDKMYTASIAVPQSVIFKPERYSEMLALLDALAPMIDTGRATYVTYAEAVEIWRNAYDAQPNIFVLEGTALPTEREADSADRTEPRHGEEAPLFLTTMTHLEGDFKDDQNEEIFNLHVEQLRYGLTLANEYGAKFTIESEQPFARACETWGVNALQEVLDLGHGVGTHCDVGFQYTPGSPQELAQLYLERKELVDALVGPEHNRGYSGGGSEQDWILAAQEAGFVYKDGGVGMLYLSMPLENRPSTQWTDEYIRTTAFHNPAPIKLENRIYPFLMADAQDFVPDEDGILFSGGGIGRLDSMVEGGPTNCPQMRCPFTEEDVELVVAEIREIDGWRDRNRLAKVNVYVPLHLLQAKHEAIWRSFFEQAQTLEQEGIVTWATQGEVYDAYQAWPP
jgi:pimeloyl-ACP methyl ester carboxylesterase